MPTPALSVVPRDAGDVLSVLCLQHRRRIARAARAESLARFARARSLSTVTSVRLLYARTFMLKRFADCTRLVVPLLVRQLGLISFCVIDVRAVTRRYVGDTNM